jgi:hypothetical protein
MTEDQLQAACFQWAWTTYPPTRRLLWAVPNGGTRHLREAAKLKATGLIAGVYDLHFFWRGKLHCFELKVNHNQLTPAQLAWGALVAQHGAKIYGIRTFEEFKTAFANILL